MSIESIRTVLTKKKNEAVAYSKDKIAKAKPRVQDAYKDAKDRAQKVIDDNKRLQDAQARAKQLQDQATQGIAAARKTIQDIQDKPAVQAIGNAAKASTHAVQLAARPHVQATKEYVSTQAPVIRETVTKAAHDAGSYVGAQATELGKSANKKVVGATAKTVFKIFENPETWTNLRTEAGQNIQARVNTAAENPRTPQEIMRGEFKIDDMDGIKRVGAEAGVVVLSAATRTLGWATASLLNFTLGLDAKDQMPIGTDQMSDIIARKVTIPAVLGLGKAMGTIYERGKEAIQTRFTPLPPSTQAF